MNVVYILQAHDDTLYTGWTNNLDARYRKHCRKQGAKFTRAKKRLKLVYVEACADRSEAMKREWAIKQLSREQKLELIQKK